MTPLDILYFGPAESTCLDRANAYRRLGHRVEQLDLRSLLPATSWVDRVAWRAGGHWFAPLVEAGLRRRLAGRRFDVCHVDAGEWVAGSTVKLLRRHCSAVVNYNMDDPLGPRDGMRFHAYRKALPFYDLVAVVREPNVKEARALGARNVLRVFRSADEVSHAPRLLGEEDHRRWDCEVLFAGTWMPERGPFLAELVRRGVPLTLYGSHWRKAPEWPVLQPHWRSEAIVGDDYAKAIQAARITLGLVSKGNRDLHTVRSLEVPSLGGLLCAERTTEHLQMYAEGEEAVFWSDAEECAAACRRLLADEPSRRRVAANGRARLLRNGHLNEVVMRRILESAGCLGAATRADARAAVPREAALPAGGT